MSDAAKVMVERDASEVARTRAAMGAAEGEPGAAVVQRVLNGYLLKALLDDVNVRSTLSEEEADEIAVREVHGYRRVRNATS